MTMIPFTKAHGAKNDFLLTWAECVGNVDIPRTAVSICDRHTGAGADGWLIVSKGGPEGAHGTIRLFNPDGGEAEISGNGTRCAAAFLVNAGLAGDEVRVATGAGVKHLRLLHRGAMTFEFLMNMGQPEAKPENLRFELPLSSGNREATVLNVGNPQCALFVTNFDFDWRRLGAEIERAACFPNRTNVSFVRIVNQHTIDVRFWERGAGETMSSGTGSTGAAVASVLRGLVTSPITVLTPAGPLLITWDEREVFMTGPAEIVATGEFLCPTGAGEAQ